MGKDARTFEIREGRVRKLKIRMEESRECLVVAAGSLTFSKADAYVRTQGDRYLTLPYRRRSTGHRYQPFRCIFACGEVEGDVWEENLGKTRVFIQEYFLSTNNADSAKTL